MESARKDWKNELSHTKIMMGSQVMNFDAEKMARITLAALCASATEDKCKMYEKIYEEETGASRSGSRRGGKKGGVMHWVKKGGSKKYRKGSKSKTMKGKKDFTTKKSSKVFNRRRHYQKHAQGSKKHRRPFAKRRGGAERLQYKDGSIAPFAGNNAIGF